MLIQSLFIFTICFVGLYQLQMEKLKEYVNEGSVEIVKLSNDKTGQKISLSQFEGKVQRDNKYCKIYKQIQQLTWEERYEWCNFKRLKAKQFYSLGQFDQAIQIYTESLIAIDQNDNIDGRGQKMVKQLKYPITLNIATCLYRKKQYLRAVQICDKILKEKPNHITALYKKAFILQIMGEDKLCKETIDLGIKSTQQLKQFKQKDNFLELLKKLKIEEQKAKNVYAKMVGNDNEKQPLIDSDQQNEQEDQEDILYYEQDPTNICSQVYRKIRDKIMNLYKLMTYKRKKSKK